MIFVLTLAGCAGIDPRKPSLRPLFTEGLAYEALSEYSHALDRYRKVISLSPSTSKWSRRSHLRMARVHRNHLNNPNQALNHYRRFLEISKDQNARMNARFELARVLRSQKQYTKAVRLYQKIIDSASSDQIIEEGYYFLGETYLDSKQYEQAIKTYRTFLNRFGNGDLAAGAWFNLAKAYGSLDRFPKQLEGYRKILENFPESDLREYTFLQGVRTAASLGKQSLAITWSKGYLNEFDKGQYWSDIKSTLQESFEVSADDLSPEPIVEPQEAN